MCRLTRRKCIGQPGGKSQIATAGAFLPTYLSVLFLTTILKYFIQLGNILSRLKKSETDVLHSSFARNSVLIEFSREILCADAIDDVHEDPKKGRGALKKTESTNL